MTLPIIMSPAEERARIEAFIRRTIGSAVVLLGILLASVFTLQAVHSNSERLTSSAREVARIAREAQLIAEEVGTSTSARQNADTTRLAQRARVVELRTRLDSLAMLTKDNPAQHALAQELIARAASEFPDVVGGSPTPETSISPRDVEVGAVRRGGIGEFRSRLSEFLSGEEAIYRRRMSRQQRLGVLLPASMVVEVAVMLVALWLVRRMLSKQTDSILRHREVERSHNEILGQQNEELTQQTAQLAEQSIELEEHQQDLEATLEGVRSERERFETLLSSMSDSVYTIDLEARITEVFLAPAVRGRWDVSTIIGRTPMERFGTRSAEEHARASAAALSNTPVAFEWQHELNGELLHYSTALEPLHDAAGAVCGAVGVTRDRTAEKRREEELLESKNRLHHAQKLEAVGLLAGGIAHDFNNLLTVIIAYADMLGAGGHADEEDALALKEIGGAGRRAAALTRQLLAFSRRENPERRQLDFCHTVRGVELLLRRMVSTDVELEIVIPEGLSCMVMADAGQVGQVVMNLVINANAAMPEGGTLRVAIDQLELGQSFAAGHPGIGAGPHMRLTVSDTGVGMSEDVISRIFEPFFTTKPAGEGTGLGLATVHGIVQYWGGYIDVVSAPGRGSTFLVYLPVVESTAVGVPSSQTIPGHVGALPKELPKGGATILVVDDEPAIRGVTSRILRVAGYHVVEVGNGVDALRVLDADPLIRCVVSDMVMPAMGGRELAHEMRVRNPHVALLLMSGLTRDTHSSTDAPEARVGFIAKPFTAKELLEAVDQSLGRQSRPATAKDASSSVVG